MNKKRVPLVVAIFFLVQSIASSQAISLETWTLNPPTKVSLNKSDICFKYLFETIYSALSLYRLDTIERYSKDALIREYGNTIFNPEVRFDLEHIDIGKKGWTRYYPFSIGGRHFIIRIFLTDELTYQPKVMVLFESAIQNPAVTLQILPGLNEILRDCRIRPHDFYPVSPAATSP